MDLAFDLALALRRIAWRTVIGFLGVAVISALMIWLTAKEAAICRAGKSSALLSQEYF